MGQAYSSAAGDLASLFYNPAGTATMNGLQMMGSYSSPLYAMEKAHYDFLAVGYQINRYLSIGLSRNHFTNGS